MGLCLRPEGLLILTKRIKEPKTAANHQNPMHVHEEEVLTYQVSL